MSDILETKGYASFRNPAFFEPFNYRLPDLRGNDMLVEVEYCGLCRTDLYLADEEWGSSLTLRPLVAGHEAIGRVKQMGSLCKRFKLGEVVGIGFISEACGECGPCEKRKPVSCDGSGFISTYSAVNIYRKDRCLGTGGFARQMVIHERYAIEIPIRLSSNPDLLPFICPLLCSGVAIWSSLRQLGCLSCSRPKRIGIVGLGTAGHVAAQICAGLGHELTCFSYDARKESAIKTLCPKCDFVFMTSEESMSRHTNRLHILIDCSPGQKPFKTLLEWLKPGGKLVALAIPPEGCVYGLDLRVLTRKQITVMGTFMGSIDDADDLLEWVAKEGGKVRSHAQIWPISRINEAMQLMKYNDLFDGQKFGAVFDLKA